MTKRYIYLFRHGQTYYNRDHIFTGWKDSKLTEKGKKDAQIVSKKLKNKRIDVAIQTRLSRSKDTLKIVLKNHPECKKIITDDRMIERSYGKLQGISHKKYAEKNGEKELQKIRRGYKTTPPEGENIPMVEKRVKEFIKDITKMIKKEKVNVAISAHGNSIRAFRKIWDKLTIDQTMKIENPWDDYFEYEVEIK